MRVLGGMRLRAAACIAAGEVTLSYPSEMLSARGRACLERKNKPSLGCAQSRWYPEGLSAAVSAAGTGGRRLVSEGSVKSGCAKQSKQMWSQLSLGRQSPFPRSCSPLAGPEELTEPLLPPMAPCKVGAGHHLSKRATAVACNWGVRMDLAHAGEIIPAAR